MTSQTEKMLTTSWKLVRDAGSAVGEVAASTGTSLAKALPHVQKLGPKVKEMVSVGAGLAVAKRGAKIAVGVVKRNPVAAIAGAVALAGLGVAVAVAKRRKEARANGEAAKPRVSKRMEAKNMRGNGATKTAAAKTAAAKPARAPRARKAKPTTSTTH